MPERESHPSPTQRLRDAFAGFKARLRKTSERWRKSEDPRKKMVVPGIQIAVLLALVLGAVTSAPGREDYSEQALSGQELFDSLMEEHPELRRNSQIASGTEHIAPGNQMVLPMEMWKELDTDQRNSLALWLDSKGTEWEIRVGKLSADGWQITSQEAVITSSQWHQQLK